jgi:hypothetical protein
MRKYPTETSREISRVMSNYHRNGSDSQRIHIYGFQADIEVFLVSLVKLSASTAQMFSMIFSGEK